MSITPSNHEAPKKNRMNQKKNSQEQNLTQEIQRIAQLEKELLEIKDERLRQFADFENFKKRLLRDKQEAILLANRGLLEHLVEFLDSIQRALQSDLQGGSQNLHEGLSLAQRQLESTLSKQYALQSFGEPGDHFNPEIHEALLVEKNEEAETPYIAEIYQKGYMLHDKVLRHAKVKVVQKS